MHRDHLPLLACPRCRGTLDIISVREEDRYFAGEILHGVLGCGCGGRFDVVDGVAVFESGTTGRARAGAGMDPDARENKEIWDYVWSKLGQSHESYFCSEAFFEQEVLLPPSAFQGRRVLEVGIAMGKNIPFLLKREPSMLVGLDITDQLFDTYRRFASSRRLSLVLADVKSLPLASGAFDLVIASRILHHIPDMPRRFADLADLLAEDGVCTSVIYGKSDTARAVRLLGTALSRLFTLDQLFHLSSIPSWALYAAIHGIYGPFGDTSIGRRLLPLRDGMRYWSKFDREWLWKAVVFDILASAPVTTYTSENELRELLDGLSVSRYEYVAQFGAMWNLTLHR